MSAPSSIPSLKSWLLGGAVPIAVVAAGVTLFMAMGKSEPKQIVQDDSPIAQLMRRPIVDVEPGKDFEPAVRLIWTSAALSYRFDK